MTASTVDDDIVVPFERSREDQAWARWVARLADGLMLTPILMFAFLLLGALVELGRAPAELLLWLEDPIMATVIEIIALFILFALWEPLFISNTRTTPGKWIMGIRVVRTDGTKLSFLRALNRFVRVWFVGMGSRIPLLSLITMLIARATLVSDGIVAWDRQLDCQIEHRKRHPALWTLVIVIVLALNFGIAILAKLSENW